MAKRQTAATSYEKSSREGGARAPRPWFVVFLLILAPAAGWIASAENAGSQGDRNPLQPFTNPTGMARTFSITGPVETENPFFQSLGTNGRACVTCHVPATGWTIAPAEVQQRFENTDGLDPIFRTNDGSNSPFADVSTVEARRSAYNMLLNKGLIRVGIGIPAGAEFTLEAVDDPYGFASSQELSLFRRPLPATNLAFLSGVMWDGRETFAGKSISFDLMDQANGATLGHAQASAPLSTEQQEQIVAFETALFTAQIFDAAAGDLIAKRALGGPDALSGQEFFIGINDPFGLNPDGTPFSPVIFTDFTTWTNLDADPRDDNGRNAARAAVARGRAVVQQPPDRHPGREGAER